MNLNRLKIRMRAAIRHAVGECDNLLADDMRSRVPVDTGELKDSIKAHTPKVKGSRVSGVVIVGEGLDDERAVDVEYGNDVSTAEPFARPANRRTKKARISVIHQAARKAIGNP